MPLRERAFIALQHCLPRRWLTRLVYRLTRIRLAPLKNLTIRWFVRQFRVDVSEAENAVPGGYLSFNDFFTRALRTGARPLPQTATAFSSPCDGTVSQLGRIDGGTLLQAKGHRYSVAALLGDAGLAGRFDGGRFVTIYLAPYDYHRVHMPIAGRLRRDRRLGADLYSVNDATARRIDRLFVRNERVVALFDSDAGPLALVFVGALNVGSVSTVWGGELRAGFGTPPADWHERDLALAR
ncbi:MAG: archaetidylserine decarboxylase, partial [Pseudomonadota bacterium]